LKIHLVSLTYIALLLAGTANAQTPPAHSDTTKGNDLVGSPQPPPANPLTTPPTAGQDKSTGNDVVSPNKAQAAGQDKTKGNDLVGDPQPPPANSLATPATPGQDKSAGNDLVGPNKAQAQSTTGAHSRFDTLDAGGKGYLTERDVKSHKWLTKNFAKCDLNHDGQLSRDEYSNCHK
jgi:hypothetical protein